MSEPLTVEETEALRTWDTDRMAPFTVGTILATLDAARDRPGPEGLRCTTEHVLGQGPHWHMTVYKWPLAAREGQGLDVLRQLLEREMAYRADASYLAGIKAAIAALAEAQQREGAGEPDPERKGMPKCPCGDIAYQPDPVAGRQQAWRCGGCHRTLTYCDCAQQREGAGS